MAELIVAVGTNEHQSNTTLTDVHLKAHRCLGGVGRSGTSKLEFGIKDGHKAWRSVIDCLVGLVPSPKFGLDFRNECYLVLGQPGVVSVF